MQEKIIVMGVRFDNVTLDEASGKILEFIKRNKKGYICTPNPEMLLEAAKNDEFENVLNRSHLNIADGIGILWAATHINNKSSKFKAIISLPLVALYPKSFKKVLKERVTGTDLLQKLCKASENENIRIFLLGAAPGIAEKAAQILEAKYPKLRIVGTYSGSPSKVHKDEIIETINETKPDLLFVAYGAPAQELWISENLKHLNSVKIAIGIGGAFDFIVGKRKRAPKWMRKTGLEWLYRLIQEPTRIKRIYNATIKFPIEIIKDLN